MTKKETDFDRGLGLNNKQIAAKQDFELRYEESNDRMKFAIDYGLASLKGVFFANGGAVLALLTFLGNTDVAVGERGLFWSFVWFLLGVAAAIAAQFCGYVMQDQIMNATYNDALQKRSDAFDLGETFESEDWENKSENTRYLLYLFAGTSLAFFVVGAFVALEAVL